MYKGIVFILLMTTVSSCSVFRSVTLVDKGLDRRSKIELDGYQSFLVITGGLLDSKISSRSGTVIFNVSIVSKDPHIRFESDNVSIYIYEYDSSAFHKLVITGNELNVEPVSGNRMSKFRIFARIDQANISDSGANKRIGLQLPPIVVGCERIDLGVVELQPRRRASF